ncbi:MAG: Hsp20/alpha crystallin family protein [Vicinamibacterales bacterium]
MAVNTPVKAGSAPLVPWERSFGFPLLNRLSREFDAMFDRFGLEKPFLENMPATWTPQMEMSTQGNELKVMLDVPGMKKEDLTIEVADEHLVVRGERKQEKEEKKEGYFRSERTYGTFYRTVPLPEGVKPELAKATMHDGVLEIVMPMAAVESKARKLEISEPVAGTTTKAA